MFSVYNDYINNVVYIADEEGNISEYENYTTTAIVEASIELSLIHI